MDNVYTVLDIESYALQAGRGAGSGYAFIALDERCDGSGSGMCRQVGYGYGETTGDGYGDGFQMHGDGRGVGHSGYFLGPRSGL